MTLERLPKPHAVAEFKAAGGEIDYSFFHASSYDKALLKEALQHHFAELEDLGPVWRPWLDIDFLDQLPLRTVDQSTFFGDWYDLEHGDLKLLGSGTITSRGHLIDPTYRELDRASVKTWGAPSPDVGSGGQYAYAFCRPPYALLTEFAVTQRLFDEINLEILPRNYVHRIIDLSSPKLPMLSNYFESGMEWWGVFLFIVYIPMLERLTVISASATD